MFYTPGNPPENGVTRFIYYELRKIAAAFNYPESYAATEFSSVSSTLNTKNKIEGKQYWDNTNKRPLWPTGTEPTATWVDGSGVLVYSPA